MARRARIVHGWWLLNLPCAARVVLVLALAGCSEQPDQAEQPDPTPVPLADMTDWVRITDASHDVFADQRPPGAVCDDTGWYYEPMRMSVEVLTGLCDYVTLGQPTLEPLEPGDVIDILGLYGALWAAEPAEGYIAIAIDGEIVWELTVSIPNDAAVIDEQFTVDRSVPLGSEMQLHVHNHGLNSWDLTEVMVTHAP
jgi:hypothetical protein